MRALLCTLALLGLFSSGARAQELAAPPMTSCLGFDCAGPTLHYTTPWDGASQRRARWARAASIVGLAGAGVTLASTITIAATDPERHEALARGLTFGWGALLTPLVALSTYGLQDGSRGPRGYASIRQLGWLSYSMGFSFSLMTWVGTVYDQPRNDLLGVSGGVFATVSLLAHAFDAYVIARVVSLEGLALQVLPLGARLSLQF